MKTICTIVCLFVGSSIANATTQAKSSADRPVRLYVESYKYSEHAEVHPSGEGNSNGTQTYSFQQDVVDTWETYWTDGVGGGASYDGSGSHNTSGSLGDNSSSWTEVDTYHWDKSDWPNFIEGTETIDSTFTDNDGVTTPYTWSGTANPPDVAQPGNNGGFLEIGYEHCAVKDSQPGNVTWSDGAGGSKTAKDNVVYSRTADTIMKLFTGGKALSKRKNLFMLSASAKRSLGMKLKPNLLTDWDYWEWELPPEWGIFANIDPTQVTVDGLPLDSDGSQWRLYDDNDTRDVTPRVKNEDFYTFDVEKQKYYLVSRCSCPRQDLARTTVGVGEVVSIYFSYDVLGNSPSVLPATAPIDWRTTAGSLSPATSYCGTVLTSPNSANTATVTATVRGQASSISFSVIEPSGIKATIRALDSFSSGYVGAGMYLDVVLQPTTVSFGKVEIEEPAEATTGITGYFTTHTPPTHAGNGADIWHPVNCDNLVVDNYFDHASSYGWAIGQGGSYTWPIHPLWRVVGDTITHSLSGWTDQIMTLSSDGTMRIDKLGHYVTRHP